MIELLWNAPVSEAKMTTIIDTLSLEAGDQVLDVGCGCGEVLIRLCVRHGIRGTGIDNSTAHLTEARSRARDRGVDSRLQFIEGNAETFVIAEESLSLVLCLGATHAFVMGSGAVGRAIGRMCEMIVPGGHILIADGFIRQPKPPGYRKFIGDELPDDQTHAAIVTMGMDHGLAPMAAWTSNVDEWDNFEWAYQRIIEQKAAANPDDRDCLQKRDSRREWMDAYLKWGRDTLGYGTYLFRKPGNSN